MEMFKQEVESYLSAVNRKIPKGFLHGPAAVTVALFAIYCAAPNHFCLLPRLRHELA